jgi:hypothetical protein
MSKEVKKPNVNKVDGKYYVNRIKRVVVKKRIGNLYIVDCEIKMRGIVCYSYYKNDGFITKYDPNGTASPKILYLEDLAFDILNAYIYKFDDEIKKMEITKYKHECYFINYIKNDNNYDVYFEYVDENNVNVQYILNDVSINDPRFILHNYPISELLMTEEIDNSPLYILSKERNDLELQRELRIRYGVETKEDCIELSKTKNYEVLPKLDKSFDINFVVSDITNEDSTLLDYSGYHILHRPYFAMKGSTHSKWTLNPYTKSGVDAAGINEKSITFEEYKEIIYNNIK